MAAGRKRESVPRNSKIRSALEEINLADVLTAFVDDSASETVSLHPERTRFFEPSTEDAAIPIAMSLTRWALIEFGRALAVPVFERAAPGLDSHQHALIRLHRRVGGGVGRLLPERGKNACTSRTPTWMQPTFSNELEDRFSRGLCLFLPPIRTFGRLAASEAPATIDLDKFAVASRLGQLLRHNALRRLATEVVTSAYEREPGQLATADKITAKAIRDATEMRWAGAESRWLMRWMGSVPRLVLALVEHDDAASTPDPSGALDMLAMIAR